MEYDAYQTIFAQSIYVISILCVVKLGYGLIGVFIALILTFASECILGFYVVSKKFMRLRLRGNCDLWKYLLKEAYPNWHQKYLKEAELQDRYPCPCSHEKCGGRLVSWHL